MKDSDFIKASEHILYIIKKDCVIVKIKEFNQRRDHSIIDIHVKRKNFTKYVIITETDFKNGIKKIFNNYEIVFIYVDYIKFIHSFDQSFDETMCINNWANAKSWHINIHTCLKYYLDLSHVQTKIGIEKEQLKKVLCIKKSFIHVEATTFDYALYNALGRKIPTATKRDSVLIMNTKKTGLWIDSGEAFKVTIQRIMEGSTIQNATKVTIYISNNDFETIVTLNLAENCFTIKEHPPLFSNEIGNDPFYKPIVHRLEPKLKSY